VLVNSILHPVGPEPPGTYWLRRGFVIAGLIGLFALAALLWPGGGDSQPTTASATETPSATPGATSSPTPSATPTESASTPADPQACRSADLDVTVALVNPNPIVGGEVVFEMAIANNGESACTQDVGPAATSFTITSGGFRVWSSDDCNPEGGNQVELIPPGQAFVVQATWPTIVTTPGCPTQDQRAQAGTYDVVGTDDGLSSAPVRFVLS
jgi:hypothetical protein